MSFRHIAATIILYYALVSFAAESQLEQTEENSEAIVPSEVDGSASSDSVAADALTEPFDEEESPGRFVPTEQISQDLGVSFPVDI
tara:strand:- start:376 stop:633 length:258 start_codon:yes stop_codon:yes gene_type:complete